MDSLQDLKYRLKFINTHIAELQNYVAEILTDPESDLTNLEAIIKRQLYGVTNALQEIDLSLTDVIIREEEKREEQKNENQ